MLPDALGFLTRQFDTAWKLAAFHLEGLTTEECLWRPAPSGPHVRQASDGRWQGEWPEHEGYGVGPPSIAWLTWHVGFWWSMVLDHSFGAGYLKTEEVFWPGSAEAARAWIHGLSHEWRQRLAELSITDLASSSRTKWPFKDRPFGDVVAWASIELAKNSSEIGYARFLYASSVGRRKAEEP